MKNLLAIHQGSELYGSDRSFATSIAALKCKYNVDVTLPNYGPLTEYIDFDKENIKYQPNGIMRKQELLSNPFMFFLLMIKSVFYYIKEYKNYDVIYINTIVCLSALIAAAFNRKVRKYCHVREIPSSKLMPIFKLVLKFSGTTLIYNSHETKSAFDLPGFVVLNGVEDPVANKLKEPDFSPMQAVNLLLIGRINNWKGHQLLLNAVSEINSNNIKLRIVGSVFKGYEELLGSLQKYVTENDLADRVEFFDFEDNPERHFLWADYVVVPSTKPEPFGRVAVEAMAYSVPVIVASHGGLSSIVNDEVNGFHFKPCDLNSLVKTINKAVNNEKYDLMSIESRHKFESVYSDTIYKKNLLETVVI